MGRESGRPMAVAGVTVGRIGSVDVPRNPDGSWATVVIDAVTMAGWLERMTTYVPPATGQAITRAAVEAAEVGDWAKVAKIFTRLEARIDVSWDQVKQERRVGSRTAMPAGRWPPVELVLGPGIEARNGRDVSARLREYQAAVIQWQADGRLAKWQAKRTAELGYP